MQEQRHGRLHRCEPALEEVRCCWITHRVPALSELRLRAPPRYATRWRTHEGLPVQYRHKVIRALFSSMGVI